MAFNYNPDRAAQVPDYEVLPAGEYQVLITDVEDKESRNGGNYLKVSMQVISGPRKGFIVTDLINYNNSNPKAEEIAYRTLKKIARICFGRDDQRFASEDLIGKKMTIQTKIEDNGEFQNTRVKNYVVPVELQKSYSPTVKSGMSSPTSSEDEFPF